jgi:hypothetical protein
VARSFWVVASSAAVDCRERRFWRTDAERTIPDIAVTFLVFQTHSDPSGRLTQATCEEAL